SRSTSNIIYDERLRQYVLGERSARRTSRNIRHIRPFTQMVWAADFAKELKTSGKTSTLRDVYYSAQAFDVNFTDQQESDNIITDLETVLATGREDLNIFPEERSEIFGDLTIEYTTPGYEGRRINLTMHPDGVAVGPALTTAELVETTADKVIVIEKGAMFTRFIEEQAFRKFNAILVHTAGQPPRATRHLVQRLNSELGLPVYVFCDGDPWGMAIAITIICGSANAAHLKELTTQDAKWMGLYSSDIQKYKLPSTKLQNVDVKRLLDMQKDPRCMGEPWTSQIDHFLKNRVKCELEAFSRYGLDYVVKKYLPDKLQELT
ncbi:DNA topoisomerase IV subunit A, partial [Candidatus Bathyarchaeota archaeon]|nr:DNA topoisomerase IV subunit A [Candidatus Bathyarchaeota archaeon]